MKPDYPLSSGDELTALARHNGINSWSECIRFVQALPYGRNRNRSDFSLVLSEKRGTCSSKHAFLKQIADLNHIPDIKLILGIYKMNADNTPGIGTVLADHSIDFIPEAHCYLKIDGQRLDITNPGSDVASIENDILQEKGIEAVQVAEFKVNYHQNFLKKWLQSTNSTFEFEEIWSIREECIRNLAQ